MRPNNEVLLENVNDYLQHVGILPKQIDKVQHSLKKDMKKSDEKDIDYAEYRHKSHAEILQIVERNIVIVNYNPILFYILNFLLMAYLFDKKLIPFSAVTGLYIFYFVVILSISLVIYIIIKKHSYLYPNQKLMMTNILLFSIGIILCILKIFGLSLGMYVIPIAVFQAIFVVGVLLVVVSLFLKKLEVAAMGLAVIQKTIAAVTTNEMAIMITTFGSWLIILFIILYFVMIYSTRKYV
ncbi:MULTISPECIES: hypothetical protein [Mammaliicoccus]|uniref:Integral membrane protein n=1 Tax=Mammaliicoccus fleurettii TaxID=150056 RepID=A0ABS5MQA0_9STAP|nr:MULTISPECIES: hypothetical protein [Mammaliicoccus]HCN59492.1 hypothetical protein [Staphylococcus sp.]MBL0848067.1 hypothetical protein [Mammaliicoccus fleurettii]MBO3063567.1 hypothetical protein [Mammaliicoccus fleurettii]MBS3672019.1 hypothetical protein [Mammaliicoccus fleurettii]MBS3697811.1 hypothetical protein [Mammaliicoccus fleurettii]